MSATDCWINTDYYHGLLGAGLFAQPAKPRLEFEVASIKPADAPAGPKIMIGMSVDKGQVHLSNMSLREIVMRAYSVRTYQVSGPDWINAERFDIAAKLPEGASKDEIPQMMQSLLEDRFKLKLHREQKEYPVYALVVGKNGSKLKPTDEDGNIRMAISPKGRQMNAKATMERFSDALSNMVDRPVVDETGLKGFFDITLEWSSGDNVGHTAFGPKIAAMEAAHAAEGPGPDAKSELETGPSIYSAVQEQLGLKLEAKKAPLDILIIDNMEKTPTEN